MNDTHPVHRWLAGWLPSRCVLCQTAVSGRQPLCIGCRQALPWQTQACARCAEPLPQDAGLCGACLQQPPPFKYAVCALRYAFPVDSLLNRYKHRRQLHCGHLLASLLAEHLHQHYRQHDLPLPEAVIPVPLHWRRLRSRGFDQGLEIARVVARQLALPLHTPLQRTRQTPSQQHLSREERQQNLVDAFAMRQPWRGHYLPPASVALVDDVLTTGSTAAEITRVLHSQGVQAVHVWSIARTP